LTDAGTYTNVMLIILPV